MPVAGSRVNVPSPAIVTTPSASQTAGFEPGVIKHTESAVKSAPCVCLYARAASASPPVAESKIELNGFDEPTASEIVSGVATGGG